MSNELKPCPFCGCIPVDGIFEGDFTDGANFVIECPDCPCSMRFYSSTKEQAIGRWNDREFGEKIAQLAAATKCIP